jgi:hypothetical protein
MATATKKKKKEEADPWKAGTSSGQTTNLKQFILRLSISMVHMDQIFAGFVVILSSHSLSLP